MRLGAGIVVIRALRPIVLPSDKRKRRVSASLVNRPPALNFGLGEAADMLRSSVEAFAADEIAPRAAEIDRWTCGARWATSACWA
jgi:alkylation response protein AidB-like acyl-CoA dehydrogenase